MNIIFHVILLTTEIYMAKSGSLVAPSRLLVTRIGHCFGTNLPVAVSEMCLTRNGFDFTISGEFNISEDIANGWSVKTTMQKCHDIRNLDTCDHYKSLTVIRSGCDDADEDGRALQEKLFHYVTPRLTCPLKAGVYKISNYPVFTEGSDLAAVESKISTSVFGYTYRLDGFDEDYQKILCVDAFLKLVYVRNHDWIGNQKFKPGRGRNHTANDTVDNKRGNDYDDSEVINDDSNQNKNETKDEKQDGGTRKVNEDHTVDDEVVEHDDDDEEVKNDGSEQNQNDTGDKKPDDNEKDFIQDDDTVGDEDAEHDEGAFKNESTEQDKNDAEEVNHESDNEDVNNGEDDRDDDSGR